MKSFQWLYQQVVEHHADRDVEALLPAPLTADQLAAVADDRLLSDLCRRVFRAGLKHSLVDARWPAFEVAFWGFDPHKVALMSDEQLERLMQNDKLIRHFGKLKSVRANALMVTELAARHGSFARFLAHWPVDDITGLWLLLKKQGAQLGGNSGPYFLRMVGKDTFLLTDDVVAALVAQGIVDKRPTAQRDLRLVQQAFNQWQQESGRPLCQISRLLSMTVGW
ncbi:DNA-3-methyladenine glycosylase I [Marinobacterium rhizophilum]|uniref:DNA-3-methyladenine glycosylase I n=1 Tax=Marinobacterium rhizophilum TaxID=420402 RepID=A0ABY5HMY1_9GAMM|nr:DNA-3-methyladenine glycosylase I [Marinobacterium rhizophilum]UTW13783.1 DNA-3-methyladenine glycosylase I [Marinobacterium rhizophilum]